MTIKIENKIIKKGNPCFIIAEAGVNHNGNFDSAKKLVDAAKEAGIDAVKFQTFKAENIVTPDAERAGYQKKNIGGEESQYEMLKKLELPYSDFEKLKKYCDEKEIIFLTTPHSSKEDVDLAAKLCPAIKVGSGDLTNLPILEYMAEKQKPIILSTGMANLEEVKDALNAILPINKGLVLLHCTTNYPTPLNEVNLKAMETMEKEFGLPVGYSDHTEGIEVSLDAVLLGACVIEKHFTLDRKLPGPDHRASLEPKELKEMVEGIKDIEKAGRAEKNGKVKEFSIRKPEALGDGVKKPNQSELEVAKVARKGIKTSRDIKKGEKLTEEMIVIKRPETGIKPKHFKYIIGKIAKSDIKKDQAINFEDLI